jgi:DNA polymerase
MDPHELGAMCKRCPYAKNGLPDRPVMGEGPKQPIGIFVGESPGRDEAERGRPFVGATGQELDNSFIKVGLNRSKLFVVNAICCSPRFNKSQVAMQKAANRCRPALIAQLRRLSGPGTTRIFAAGKYAYFALTGSIKGLKTKRGFLREWSLQDAVKADLHFKEQLHAKKAAAARRARKAQGDKKG